MEYAVHIEIDTADPLTEDTLTAVAAIGGAATGNEGEHRLATTLTAEGPDPAAAARQAMTCITALARGRVVVLEVLTVAEADRRLDEPAFPELVGVGEVAEMLGVTRQRASALQTNREFPAPVAVLKSGPVWRKGDLSRFIDAWERKGGRPRKVAVVVS